MLQLLRSLDISIIGTSETSPGLLAFLRVFGDAPLLRSLTLDNLTELTSSISVTTSTARDILQHCDRLEICEVNNLEPVDILHQPPLCILNQMRSLNLSTTADLPFIGFFDSLAFPRLENLTLDSFAVPGYSLLELHRRSRSQTQCLAVEALRLTADEIMELLCLMPSLQTFSLTNSHCAGNIFAALTYRRDPTVVASLVLPNLKELAVAENADFLSWTNHPATDNGADGVAVVEMAESLQRYPGPQHGCLPSLRSIQLHLAGPKFAPTLEARLGAGLPGEGVAKAFISALFCIGTLNFFFLGWKLLKEGETAKAPRASTHWAKGIRSAQDYSSVYESEAYGSAAVWRC
ncbi:hypothetical protein B0H13DRAFT_1919338 [Mycena leptocephala]|nr:hypothetical protein B0H13DRAFT_1919338 [Mycena leptocephala]